ncbi:uncharacterized protein LOC113295146 [Papaver somniferum]|uniref:uncharacterized protein LOC113295146 n=1 Tax=Papaver somniferum TaxID=3469 RepID=UPI000E6FB6BD|nr:uncharacterized protein LOC113295146 [Papaver somniferum]
MAVRGFFVILIGLCFNQSWIQKFPDWGYKVGLRVSSDHAPLMGGSINMPKPVNTPYKFQKMWLSRPEFLNEVEKCWSKYINGDPAFIFQRSNGHSDNNHFDSDALDKLVKAQNEYNSREVQLNTLLNQESRIRWVKEGEANTNFFHTNLKIRKAMNCISELPDEYEDVISDQKKISDVLVQYFEKKFEL